MTYQPPQPPRSRQIPLGAEVVTADGVNVGRVIAVEGDHVVVDSGRFFPRPARLPLDLVAGMDQRGLRLDVDSAALQPPPAPLPTAPQPDAALELREERLVPHREVREVGEVLVRTVVEEIPGHLEVQSEHDEVVVEHVPVGREVPERVGPRDEDGVVVVPVYEEQLVVARRLVLTEEIRVHRRKTPERRLIEDTLRRERVVIDDPALTGWVHERYPTADGAPAPRERAQAESRDDGPLADLMKRLSL